MLCSFLFNPNLHSVRVALLVEEEALAVLAAGPVVEATPAVLVRRLSCKMVFKLKALAGMSSHTYTWWIPDGNTIQNIGKS